MSSASADQDPTRPDPLGKRALFSPPAASRPEEEFQDEKRPMHRPATREGVKALYSMDTEPRLGTVVVECSECLAHTRISVLDAGARIWWFSLWIPGKRFSRRLACPACDHRTWCRIRWTG